MVGMRTVVGVAEARAQLSDIIAQAVQHGTVTVIERYGKPAVAVVPMETLDAIDDLQREGASARPVSSASDRRARLLDALTRLRDVVEQQTPEDADLVYEALNGPYQASRGRPLER